MSFFTFIKFLTSKQREKAVLLQGDRIFTDNQKVYFLLRMLKQLLGPIFSMLYRPLTAFWKQSYDNGNFKMINSKLFENYGKVAVSFNFWNVFLVVFDNNWSTHNLS